MTVNEFKAWFSGYTENVPKQPTQKQWKRICEVVNDIDHLPTSYPAFINRYWNNYYPSDIRYNGLSETTTSGSTFSSSQVTVSADGAGYDSLSAFAVLGRKEAEH